MTRTLVAEERHGAIARLTLDRPEKHNALSRRMLAELHGALERAGAADAVRVVVLKAIGASFCSGHDLEELAAADRDTANAIFKDCTRVMRTIRQLDKPVIAQVQGLATAAGCQLAATCDLVVAGTSAQFATPGVRIGLFCSTPAVAIARAMPIKKAMELLLTGQPISASEAERLGLVSQVVEDASLAVSVQALAERIALASPTTLAIGKRTFYQQIEKPEPDAYEVACAAMVDNLLTPDGKEGIAAFLEKRPPRWQ